MSKKQSGHINVANRLLTKRLIDRANIATEMVGVTKAIGEYGTYICNPKSTQPQIRIFLTTLSTNSERLLDCKQRLAANDLKIIKLKKWIKDYES